MENPTGCEKLPRMDMDESCEYTISIHICKLVFLQHPSTKLHICTRELKYNGKIQSITHFLDCGSNFLGASYTFFVVLVIVKMGALIFRRNQDQHLWKCSNYRKHCLGNPKVRHICHYLQDHYFNPKHTLIFFYFRGMESFSQLVYSTMEFGDVVQVSHF